MYVPHSTLETRAWPGKMTSRAGLGRAGPSRAEMGRAGPSRLLWQLSHKGFIKSEKPPLAGEFFREMNCYFLIEKDDHF